LIPGSGGVFEVTVDGKLVYSKKTTGEHPDQDALVEDIRQI
jgi:selenoprotein W-related protein